MMRQIIRAGCSVLIGVTSLCATIIAAQVGAAPCPPQDGMTFFCGIHAAEDSVGLPGTDWLLAGELNLGTPGSIQGIDTHSGQVRKLYPLATAHAVPLPRYRTCPGPPDATQLSIGGMAISHQDRRPVLYAVNTGGRNSVEVFRVSLVRKQPQLTWIGCVVLPSDTNPNAVAALKNHGLAIVSMDDGTAGRMQQHLNGVATGRVFEWLPHSGLREFVGLNLRGGNGIATSADERWLYISAWAGGQIVRVRRDGSQPPQARQLNFLPDNLKWGAGSLWLVGQRPPLAAIARCTGNPCPADWVIGKLDPRTLQVREVMSIRGNDVVNYATSAVAHAGILYIHSRGMDRVGWLPIAGLERAMLR